jgi:hypothetical protein
VPNLYYGVSPELTVGFAHNTNAGRDLQAASVLGGRGLCLSGTSGGCAHVYKQLRARRAVLVHALGTMDLAGHGGRRLPSCSTRGGCSSARREGQMAAGPLMLVFDPAIFFGLTKRSDGNKEAINIPGARRLHGVAAAERRPVRSRSAGRSTLRRQLLDPHGLARRTRSAAWSTCGAQFAFDNLAGKNGGADLRTLSFGAAFHM